MVDWRLLPDAIASKWQADCDTSCTEAGCEVTWRDTRFPKPTVAEFEAALREYINSTSTSQKPDWLQFQSQMLMNGAYLRIVGTNSITLTLNSALIWMLGEVGQHPERLRDVMNTWNAIASNTIISSVEVNNLNKICVACKMPFVLEEGLVNRGFMKSR